MIALVERIKSTGKEMKGPLAFMNHWDYFSRGKERFCSIPHVLNLILSGSSSSAFRTAYDNGTIRWDTRGIRDWCEIPNPVPSPLERYYPSSASHGILGI